MHQALKGIPLPDTRDVYDLVNEHTQKYSDEYVIEHARADAANNIPAVESEEVAPFEKQILHDSSLLASKIATKYKKALELLDATIKAEEVVVEKQHEHSSKDIQEYTHYSEQNIDHSPSLVDARKQLAVAEDRYNKFYEKYGRSPIIYIPHWLYIFLALAIFAGEIPLNALVFQIFGENQVMTWVMAVIIGLAVPLSAHFIGIKFREHPNGIHWANLVKGIIGMAVITIALYGLSVMRQTYLGEFKEALGLTDTLVQSSFMFFWLNIAVLGAAIMIAYMSHDSVPGYQRAELDLKVARRRVEKLEKTRLRERRSSRYEKLGMIKGTNEELRTGSSKVTMLKGYYDMVLKEGQELELQCLHSMRHDIENYRRENLQARVDKTKPKSFNIDLHIALRLSEISEKLVN